MNRAICAVILNFGQDFLFRFKSLPISSIIISQNQTARSIIRYYNRKLLNKNILIIFAANILAYNKYILLFYIC